MEHQAGDSAHLAEFGMVAVGSNGVEELLGAVADPG
jgi:hypothetical protein